MAVILEIKTMDQSDGRWTLIQGTILMIVDRSDGKRVAVHDA